MIIDTGQLGNESIFLSDNTGAEINQQGPHQGSGIQNAETVDFALVSSKYKIPLAFFGSAVVGNTTNNDSQLVSLSQEEVQFVSGLHENNSIDANDWIELGLSSYFNRSMKSVAKKFSLQKDNTLDQI